MSQPCTAPAWIGLPLCLPAPLGTEVWSQIGFCHRPCTYLGFLCSAAGSAPASPLGLSQHRSPGHRESFGGPRTTPSPSTPRAGPLLRHSHGPTGLPRAPRDPHQPGPRSPSPRCRVCLQPTAVPWATAATAAARDSLESAGRGGSSPPCPFHVLSLSPPALTPCPEHNPRGRSAPRPAQAQILNLARGCHQVPPAPPSPLGTGSVPCLGKGTRDEPRVTDVTACSLVHHFRCGY